MTRCIGLMGLNDGCDIKQRSQHLVEGLSRQYQILYVNPVAPSIFGNMRRVLEHKKVRNWLPHFERLTDALYLFTPPALLPFTMDFNIFNWCNQMLLSVFLKRIMHRLGLESPILWLNFPLEVELIGRLGERLVCYDCMDNHSELWSHVPRRHTLLERLEQRLLTCAQVVFASSRGLVSKCRRVNPNVHLLPNACQLEHFAKTNHLRLPMELRGLSRPLVGYIGTISHWLDLDLVRDAALAYPTYSFVLVGPVETNIMKYKDVENLSFLGARPYSSIPAYLHAFDVCMIPFKVTAMTRDVDPVKLYEYFAAGKPVVATELPELMRYGELCYISTRKSDFISNIKMALRENYDDLLARRSEVRIAIARDNTWEKRVAAVSEMLREVEM